MRGIGIAEVTIASEMVSGEALVNVVTANEDWMDQTVVRVAEMFMVKVDS